MKRLIASIFILLSSFGLYAQSEVLPAGLTIEELPDEYLDTLDVKKKLMINDYSMFGVSYGVNLSQVMWNPTQSQDMLILPMNIGISYTKYGKMFGYMPFFGFQIGLMYTQEGYQFKYNEEDDYTYKIEGAEKAIMDVLEVPMLFQVHIDSWNFKIMAEVGFFGGYRLGIHRFPGKFLNRNRQGEMIFFRQCLEIHSVGMTRKNRIWLPNNLGRSDWRQSVEDSLIGQVSFTRCCQTTI